MPGDDYTQKVLKWLCDAHEMEPEAAIPMAAGLLFGLALACEHPTYAAAAHARFGEDYKKRLAGTRLLFDVMAAASGDPRTSPEKMADELVEACPVPT